MKIYVGTLYCGENEFDECIAAIQQQTYKNFDHFIFRDLPNREAHQTLFKSFLAKADEYDVLVKVDADTVISNDRLFEKIVEKFSQNGSLEVLSIAVQDFFCGQLISAGMAMYRNTVRWDFDKDTMFVDIPETSKNNYTYDKTELAPAAIHCKNPSPYHAFHYGVHRGLKSIQRIHSTTHWAMLDSVWKNFLKTGERRIGLAVLGAELVYAGICRKSDVDYTNPRVKTILEKYQNMNSQEIKRQIQILRFFNWGFLPGDFRRRLIRSVRESSEKTS